MPANQWVLLATLAATLYVARDRVGRFFFDPDAISSEELLVARAYAMRYILTALGKTRYFAVEGSTAYQLRYAHTPLPRPVSRIVRFVDFVTFDLVLWTQHWRAFLPRERAAPVLLSRPITYEGTQTAGLREGDTALLVRLFAFERGSTIVRDCLAIVPLVSLLRVTGAYASHLFPDCAPGRLCLIPGVVAKDGLVRDRRISARRLRADTLRIACDAIDRHDPSQCDGCFHRPPSRAKQAAARRRARARLLRSPVETEYFHFACPEDASDAAGCQTVTLRRRPSAHLDGENAMPLFAIVTDVRAVTIEEAYATQLTEEGVAPSMLQQLRRTDFFRDDPELRRLRREVAGARDVCGPEFDVMQLDDVLAHLFERGYVMREVAMADAGS